MKLTITFGRLSITKRNFEANKRTQFGETAAWLKIPTGHYAQVDFKR